MADAIGQWLNAAGRYKLLSQEETIQLSREISKTEPGSKLHTQLVNKFCNHNLRLVVQFTKSYMNGGRKLKWGDDITTDLLQEGYFGLRRAVLKYDPERGYTFSTYASAWIRQAMGRYHVDGLCMIRVPDSTAREIFFIDSHGHARPRAESWIHKVTDSARAAYGLVSLDKKLQEDTNLLDVISEEHAVKPRSHCLTPLEDREVLYDIMSKCNITPDVQDLVIAYCKRGNLSIALAKKGYSDNPKNRRMVRQAIETIKNRQFTPVN